MSVTTARRAIRRLARPAPDGRQQHLNWLAMVEVSGQFLTLPVLLQVWPTLDALDKDDRDRLRFAHVLWRTDPAAIQAWIDYVLSGLLGWDGAYETDFGDLARLAIKIEEYDTELVPSFALVEPGEPVKPDTCRLLGLVCPPGVTPTGRIRGDVWAATPVDRVARLCRAHGVELGLVTDGRWWTLVWAPRGGVTSTATFDAMTWPEQADRDVVRAFKSLLCRRRFFAVPDEETLVPLLRRSLETGEEVTEALGTQVRRAVELLVEAFGRHDARARERSLDGLGDIPAHDVYRGAVAVMMRVVFLLFAEERGLLPADNDLYVQAYSAGRLCEELERQAREGSEEDLEHSNAGWMRLLALFGTVHTGVSHPRLRLPAYDGSIFDPAEFPWLAGMRVDDRTVMHMLRAVQYVEIGRERRRLSFRALGVEEIGYVYEGLLSFEGRRASETVVGLIGKAGLEEEVPLTVLEEHLAAAGSVDALAVRLAEVYKDSKIGTPRALVRRLAPLTDGARAEALRRLLAATGGDAALAQPLLPYVGIIRTDLRGVPVVIGQDALYVTESRLRKNTGTHYTPRALAEEVVKGALEPLVYAPGPLQTADENAWRSISSEGILHLKIADIAMGSGAFLVSACRYLADKLVEAWARDGDERAWLHLNNTYDQDAPVDTEADPVVIEARRQIIEHCLYGADINAMAVEMAKLSLWLVSMDPERPFTFLDDRLMVGDSLLGITSREQLEYMHLDPKKGRALHSDADWSFTAGARRLVADLAEERRQLAGMPGNNTEDVNRKRAKLAEITAKSERARFLADLTVGAALATAGRGERAQRDNAMAAADLGRRLIAGRPEVAENAIEQARRWLATDLPAGAGRRRPLHWPLAFPEVFERGGFDAIVGNPPFLGGKKISGATGSAYREYLVEIIAGDLKGHADLVAYFILRAHALLEKDGQAGLIATNTVCQGDTREVGLDQLVADEVEIRRAVKSKPWPSTSVMLQFSIVWTSRSPVAPDGTRMLDDTAVRGITSSLDPVSRPAGNPERLAANQGIAFIGSYVLGMGFTMTPEEAAALIRKNHRNAQVLFPYLNGEDLNQRPDCSGRRWIVNFGGRSEAQARAWLEPWEWIEQRVKPERMEKDPRKYPTMISEWWKYWRPRGELHGAIRGLERVIAITLVSKVVMPVMVPTGQVYSHALGVFATDDPGTLALLSSAPHYWWAISRASTMKGDLRYTPTDVFETFARPELTNEMRKLGQRLDTYRREKVMLARNAGLTATYNLVHDPGCKDADISELRRVHMAIDEAVMRAYGWTDLTLDHGVHETRQGTRFTVGPVARQEILDRLLELNHERYAAEVAAGLHDKKKAKRKSAPEGLFDA
jgi:hypothetical protein